MNNTRTFTSDLLAPGAALAAALRVETDRAPVAVEHCRNPV